MKLSQEEIKKLALSLLMFAGLLYCYFTFLLGPLNRSQARAEGSIRELAPHLDEANKQIKKTAEVEKKAPEASQTLDRIKALIPEGAPVAWFPPRVAEFFKKEGVEKPQTRLTTEGTEKDLPGFRKLMWTVDLPRVEFASLGRAIASLENAEPLLSVLNVSVEASKEEPQFQHATLLIATIVKE